MAMAPRWRTTTPTGWPYSTRTIFYQSQPHSRTSGSSSMRCVCLHAHVSVCNAAGEIVSQEHDVFIVLCVLEQLPIFSCLFFNIATNPFVLSLLTPPSLAPPPWVPGALYEVVQQSAGSSTCGGTSLPAHELCAGASRPHQL